MTLEKKQIARQFSRAATTYDDVASVQALMATRLIEKIPIDARGTLIDLGCGTGAALKSLASQTRLELIGIDVAAGMLAQTRLRLERVSKKVVLLERDLENTGLENECADIVFSNAAIQWCQSRLAFAEMNRILRPGGQLFVSTFGPQTLCEWRQAWQAAPWMGAKSPWGVCSAHRGSDEQSSASTRDWVSSRRSWSVCPRWTSPPRVPSLSEAVV